MKKVKISKKTKKNKTIKFKWVITHSSENGEVLDSSGDKTISIITGSGKIFPKFEEKILNLNEGDSFSFGLKAKDVFGEYDEKLIEKKFKSEFTSNNSFDLLLDSMFEIGNIIPLRNQNGEEAEATIIKINGDEITFDFNHPLAGVDCWFKGTIISTNE